MKPVEANIAESLDYTSIHCRFGHLNKASLQKLKSDNLTNFSRKIPNVCDVCVRDNNLNYLIN